MGFYEERLRHSVHDARDDGVSHEVPLISLGVVADHLGIIYATKDERKEVVVDMIDQIGNQQPTTETEHLTNGGEIPMKGRMPTSKPPIKCRIDTYIHKCLRGKSPVFKVVIGKRDADYPRKNHGYEIGEGLFSHFHLLQEQGRGCNAHTGDDE